MHIKKGKTPYIIKVFPFYSTHLFNISASKVKIIINNELFVIIFTKVEKIKVIFIEKKHNFIYNDIGTREGDNCVL